MNAIAKATAAGLLATSLFVGSNRAEPPAVPPPSTQSLAELMTTAKLGQLLETLGIQATPNKNAKGEVASYTAILKFNGDWQATVTFSVSGNQEYLWMNSAMAKIQDPKAIPSAALLDLLKYNENSGPTYFYFGADNLLRLWSVMGSATVTAETLKGRIEEFENAVVASHKLWTQQALGQAVAPKVNT